ncbi:MAG: HD domain-containing protein [Clostridia bacterium]|nr:HD domain-containing protein [Clostridia bacterium]
MSSWDQGLYIPQNVRTVLEILEDSGYSALLVGGCVRDLLMGRFPSDWDAATSASPREVSALFRLSGLNVIETGSKHGTVTVLSGGDPVEVTTFRAEGRYSDGRHPDRVEFIKDIGDDLLRRDFTVNAMAYSPKGGLIDNFGGIGDLAEGVIRCVGKPEKRFREDGLRIIRALRFASQLGFTIEEKTSEALRMEKDLLKAVSSERVSAELKKLVCGRNAEAVLMDYADVLGVAIPEILPLVGFDQKNPHHIYDVYTHSVKAASNVPARPDVRLAALFHDIGKPRCLALDEQGIGHFPGHPEVGAEIASGILKRLKFDNRTAEKVSKLVALHGYRPEASEKSVRRALIKVGEEDFADWLAVRRGDVLALAPEYRSELDGLDEVERIAIDILAGDGCLHIGDLAIDGRDVIALGVPEGPEVGRILDLCLEAVLEGGLKNEREELLAYAAGLRGGDAEKDD